jgi:hypothetical protein
MRNSGWLVLVGAVVVGCYYRSYSEIPPPPGNLAPTLYVQSIKYPDRKGGTEERIISLGEGLGCLQGKLTEKVPPSWDSYEYHPEGRILTFTDKGRQVGQVLISYEVSDRCNDSGDKDADENGGSE